MKKNKIHIENVGEIESALKKHGEAKVHNLGRFYISKFKKKSPLSDNNKKVSYKRIGFKASVVLKKRLK